MYGSKSKSVNEARSKLFKKKFDVEDKAIDLTTLIPCHSVFLLHTIRGNYIACIGKRSLIPHINEPHFTEHAFDKTGNPVWVIDPFPEEIMDIMFHSEFDEEDNSFGADVESDRDDNGEV